MTAPGSSDGSHDLRAAGTQIPQHMQSGAHSGAGSNDTSEWVNIVKMDVDDNTRADSRRDKVRKRDRDHEYMYVDAQGIKYCRAPAYIGFDASF
jgi:hypothetical protein